MERGAPLSVGGNTALLVMMVGIIRCNGAWALGTHARVGARHLAMTGAIGTESLKVGGTQFWGIQLLVC